VYNATDPAVASEEMARAVREVKGDEVGADREENLAVCCNINTHNGIVLIRGKDRNKRDNVRAMGIDDLPEGGILMGSRGRRDGRMIGGASRRDVIRIKVMKRRVWRSSEVDGEAVVCSREPSTNGSNPVGQ